MIKDNIPLGYNKVKKITDINIFNFFKEIFNKIVYLAIN